MCKLQNTALSCATKAPKHNLPNDLCKLIKKIFFYFCTTAGLFDFAHVAGYLLSHFSQFNAVKIMRVRFIFIFKNYYNFSWL